VSLAAGLLFHYFALLIWLPVGTGELLRSFARKKIDAAIWAAMILGLLPLLWPWSIREGLHAYSSGFWAQPSINFGFFYAYSLAPVVAGASAAVFGLAAQRFLVRGGRLQQSGATASPLVAVPFEEMIAAFVLCATPIWGFVLAIVAKSGLVERYVSCTIAGVVLTGCYWLAFLTKDSVLARRIALATLLLVACARMSLRRADHTVPLKDVYAIVERYAKTDASIVAIDAPLLYLPVQYYAPPALAPRLRYVADLKEAIKWTGTDSEDRGLMALARHAPIHVSSYSELVDQHTSFLVVEPDDPQWLVTKLRQDAFHIRIVGVYGQIRLLQVTR